MAREPGEEEDSFQVPNSSGNDDSLLLSHKAGGQPDYDYSFFRGKNGEEYSVLGTDVMPAVPVQRLNGHGKEKEEEESPLTLAHLTPKPKPKSRVIVDSPKRNSPSKTQTQKRKRVLFEDDDAVAVYSTPHRLANLKSAMEDWDVDVGIGGNEKMIDLTQSAEDEDEIPYHDTMQTPVLSMKGEHSGLMNVSMDMDMTSESMEVDLNTGLAGRLLMYSRELGLGGPEERKPAVQPKKQEENPTKTTSTKPLFLKPPGSTKAKSEDKPRSTHSAAKKPVSSASKSKTNPPSTRPPKPRPMESSDASSMPADSAVGVEPPTSSLASPVVQPVVSSSRLDPIIATTHNICVDVEEQASSSLITPAQAAVTSLTATEADAVLAADELEISPMEEEPPGPCFMTSDDVPLSSAAISSTTPDTAAEYLGVDSIPIGPVGRASKASSGAVVQKAPKGKAPVVVEREPLRKKPRLPPAPVPLPVKEKRAQRVVSAPVPSKARSRAPVEVKGKEKESVVRRVDERMEANIAVANATTTQKNDNKGIEFTFRSPPPESFAANDGSTSTPPSLALTFEGSSMSQQLPSTAAGDREDEMLTVSQLSPQKPVSTSAPHSRSSSFELDSSTILSRKRPSSDANDDEPTSRPEVPAERPRKKARLPPLPAATRGTGTVGPGSRVVSAPVPVPRGIGRVAQEKARERKAKERERQRLASSSGSVDGTNTNTNSSSATSSMNGTASTLTKPFEFSFKSDSRIAARKERERENSASTSTSVSTSMSIHHPIPSFQASHFLLSSLAASRKAQIHPTIPLPAPGHTSSRLAQ
ncbi:hypothetical protein V5O48_011109 [Marasmius crinis-equi]|uniref:Uncharacterized protein n=1 Tax=Marasmius crinis-equi TaxID=585013 RepID=A0ABR3F6K0_9AGAR